MRAKDLEPGHWYWLRQRNGDLAPFRFHQLRHVGATAEGEFYVGSMLATFSLGNVVAKAEMPTDVASQCKKTRD